MALAKVDSVAVSSGGALNVSVCDRKKHPASFKLPFADLETIHVYLRWKSLTKAPRTVVRGGKAGCAASSARSDGGGAAQDGVPATVVDERKSAASPAARPGIDMIARRARCDADTNMKFLTG
ncbi:hypothetical protein [Burkholderia ubonensis]|uniref:hypothetical protein n=1 Tax=Burkholderia ubonensis TaxID=101571 RepID=UPI00105425DA|nr:hypothetical protein [Burkholderia ubonensis]